MLMNVKTLAQCLDHRKCSINSDCYSSCPLPLIWRKSLSERPQMLTVGCDSRNERHFLCMGEEGTEFPSLSTQTCY